TLDRPFVPTFGRASSAVAAGEQAAIRELLTRRDLLRQVGEAYTDAKTTVTLRSVEGTNDSVLLHVEERTTLTYAKLVGDEPDYTEFVTGRDFRFARDASGWVLQSQSLSSQEGPAPINEPTGASAAAMKAAAQQILVARTKSEEVPQGGSWRASGQMTALAGYNYPAMAAYAETYWSSYNPSYRTFAERGGDCTNFVSQAMRAGGWTDVTGFYRDDNDWWYNFLNQTWSWINVDYWYAFAALRSHRTYILSQPESMLLADVLQADFTNDTSKDHTMIVSYRSSTQPYLTYHTTDTFRRSLSSLKLAYPSARWIPHRT
ncbi:MAG: hypothetical protein C4342_03400, partial [Armatimonadota bacterium]